MGIVNFLTFGGFLVDLIIISIIGTSTVLGYRKGLVGLIFKLFVFIVSLILVFALYKPVSNTIINNTGLDEAIASVIQSSLEKTPVAENENLSTSNSNLSEGSVKLINGLISDASEKAKESSTLTYVSTELSYAIVRFISMVLVFVIAKFALLFVKFFAEILASLPIISTFNKSGGLIYGLLKGLLIVYVILAIFSILSPMISSWGLISSINDALIGSKMYKHNIIINFISK